MTDLVPGERLGATSVVTSVAANAANVTALAANPARLGASVWNDGATNCYLKCGTTASTSSFTVKIAPGAFYELPVPVYSGQIDVIWDGSPSGSLRVTELS